jgi:hypothetical protein
MSERILQRELDQPRRPNCLGNLANVGTLLNVGKSEVQWVLERRVVEQIEELGAEPHALPFPDLECLA